MEDDNDADSTTHLTDLGQGATNKTTNSTMSTVTTDGKEVGGTEQGNYSSDQGKTAANTTTNDTITSLAELRPGGEVHFRTLKEFTENTKQEVQNIRTPTETRTDREKIQTVRGVSNDEITDAQRQLSTQRPYIREMEEDITALNNTENRCC